MRTIQTRDASDWSSTAVREYFRLWEAACTVESDIQTRILIGKGNSEGRINQIWIILDILMWKICRRQLNPLVSVSQSWALRWKKARMCHVIASKSFELKSRFSTRRRNFSENNLLPSRDDWRNKNNYTNQLDLPASKVGKQTSETKKKASKFYFSKFTIAIRREQTRSESCDIGEQINN